jgi:hypothetical protein
MRTSLIASSLAVLSLVGLAGGAAYAAESRPSPAAPSTTVPGMDMLESLGLTPEQIQCMASNLTGIDMNDLTALTEMMTQCGITMDQLVQIGESASTTVADETVTPVPESVAATEIVAEAAAAALALLGLDQATVECLVAEASTAAPADPAAAELAFFNCEVDLAQILGGVVALDAAAGGSAGTDDLTATTAVGAPPSSTGNAMLDILLQQLAAEGITLDPEQGQCLLDNISDFDPSDVASIVAVMESCGIELTDIVPGG